MRTSLLSGVFAGCLFFPSALEAAQEGSGIFSLNLGLLVWTWVLFLLTLGILAWKAFPAIQQGLVSRADRIQEAIDAAKANREEAQALLDEHRRQLEEARRESQGILAEGREAGERLREEILTKARSENAALLEAARKEIEREKADMMETLRRETVDVAIAAAERLIRENLDDKTNRKLVQDYVAELG